MKTAIPTDQHPHLPLTIYWSSLTIYWSNIPSWFLMDTGAEVMLLHDNDKGNTDEIQMGMGKNIPDRCECN